MLLKFAMHCLFGQGRGSFGNGFRLDLGIIAINQSAGLSPRAYEDRPQFSRTSKRIEDGSPHQRGEQRRLGGRDD